MTARDAVPDEMPEFSLSGRAGLELDDQLLDAILSGQLSPEVPAQAMVVAEMLASLADPVYSGHLAGEEAARSAFARAVSPVPGRLAGPEPAAGPARPAPSWRPGRLTMRLAAGLAAVTVGLSGTVAAYAGALPAPVQNLAHFAIGAPPPPPRSGRHHSGHPATTPARSSAPASTATSPAVTGSGKAKGKGQGEHKGKAKGKSKGKAKGKAKGHSKLPPGQAKKNGHAAKTAQPKKMQHAPKKPQKNKSHHKAAG